MGWTITLYDNDGNKKASFNRSAALEQKFKRDTDGLDSLFFQTMRQKEKGLCRFRGVLGSGFM